MKEIWQAAVKERGDRAFELFDILCGGMFVTNFCNASIESHLSIAGAVRLKPLDQLIQLDIQRYGDNAFLMYEWSALGLVFLNLDSNDDLAQALIFKQYVKRKLYANALFNLEWAMAGVPLEGLFFGEWKLLKRPVEIVHEFGPNKIVGVDSEQFKTERLRHPFPPLKELGL